LQPKLLMVYFNNKGPKPNADKAYTVTAPLNGALEQWPPP